MQQFRESFKNAPAVKAGLYRELRLGQLRRLLGRLSGGMHILLARACLETATVARELYGRFRRWLLLGLLSLGGNLVRNESRLLSRRAHGRHFLVPEGMTLREAAAPILSLLPSHLRLLGADKPSRRLSRFSALGFAGVLALIIISSHFYGLAVEIRIGERYIGVVEDETVFEKAAELCENEARRSLGQLYTLNLVPVYSLGMAREEELLSAEQLSALLFARIDEVQELYTLTVDGVIFGAVTDRRLVDDFLAGMLEAHDPGEENAKVAFAQEIEFEKKTVSLKYYMEPTELIAALSGHKTEAQTYTVKRGDTLSSIALRHGMTLTELYALNEGMDYDRVIAGDVIYLKRSVPVLQVDICRLETFEEVIEYEVQEIEDATLYVGTTRTKQKGKDGLKSVTAYITYRNGVAVGREVVSETVITEAVPKIVRVGTRSRAKAATGTFQWPCSGVVTSTYGKRPSRGDFHTGIDIANSRGTRIYAADGGKVTLVKKLNYSYGYYFVITHDNTGYQTLYAHCSEILVTEGQRVAKGELVARMGSTGNSTGNHLHLEIIYKGKKIDPRPLLPK